MAGFLAGEELSAVFPDPGVDESCVHTPHPQLPVLGWDGNWAARPTDLGGDWKVLLGGAGCVIVRMWTEARLQMRAAIFPSPLISTAMEGPGQLQSLGIASLEGQSAIR